MTWAVKLLLKKVDYDNIPSDPKIRVSFMLGYDRMQNDLVLAVLEKNREIEGKRELNKQPFGTPRSYLQARAFRELVSECQLLKPTNKCQISSKKECLTCSGTNAVLGKEGYEDCPDCKEMKQ